MSYDNVQAMAVRIAERVHVKFPGGGCPLAYALATARRDGIPLDEASALNRKDDGGLLNEGDRLMGLFEVTDREYPDRAEQIQAIILKLLDPPLGRVEL
jgi:hypothetical protein